MGGLGERKVEQPAEDGYWVAGVGGRFNSYLIAFLLLDVFTI